MCRSPWVRAPRHGDDNWYVGGLNLLFGGIQLELRADVGCGSGDQLSQAARQFPRIIGVTPSPVQATRCRRRALSLNTFNGSSLHASVSRTFTVIQSTAEACAAGVDSALSEHSTPNPHSPSPSTAVVSIDAAYHFKTRWSFLAQAATWVSPGNRCVLVDVTLPPPDPHSRGISAWTASVADVTTHESEPSTIAVLQWTSGKRGGVPDTLRGGATLPQEQKLLQAARESIHQHTGIVSSEHQRVGSQQCTLCVPCDPPTPPSRLGSALGVQACNQVPPATLCAAGIACGFDHVAVLDITHAVWRPWSIWATHTHAPALLKAGRVKDAANVLTLGVLVQCALAHGLFMRVVLVIAERSAAVQPPTPQKGDRLTPLRPSRRRRRRRSVSFGDRHSS